MRNFDNYFVDEYLTCGKNRGNFVFMGASYDVMGEVFNSLQEAKNNCVPINVCLRINDVAQIKKLISECDCEYKKVLMAECYFNSLIMSEIMKKCGLKKTMFGCTLQDVEDGLNALRSGKFDRATEYYVKAPMSSEIEMFAKRFKVRIEINVFLYNMENKYFQFAVNKFLFSRLPFAFKVFSNKPFCTNTTSRGEFVQSPHDYVLVDVLKNKKQDLQK